MHRPTVRSTCMLLFATLMVGCSGRGSADKPKASEESPEAGTEADTLGSEQNRASSDEIGSIVSSDGSKEDDTMTGVQEHKCPHCGWDFFHDGSLAGRTIPCPNCKKEFRMPGVEAPQRTVRDEALAFECTIYGHHPVQAEGRVQGHPFYFRAKWGFWTFTVCTNSDNQEIPSSITPPRDEPGLFDDEEYRGFYLSEQWGSDQEAGYMDLDTAEGIIRNCVQRFVEAIGSEEGAG